MGWGDAFGLANRLFDYFTGGRSREKRKIQSRADELAETKREALARGDLDAANAADAQLARLRREAAAQWNGR